MKRGLLDVHHNHRSMGTKQTSVTLERFWECQAEVCVEFLEFGEVDKAIGEISDNFNGTRAKGRQSLYIA